jgi:N-acetylmuramoyl-L-alanine amidase
VLQSRRFAEDVQSSLYRTLKTKNPATRNRGVKEASYVVLTGTTMPAILSEVSFVSSPADESKLQSAVYRQDIAEALYKGVAAYAESAHRVNMASASRQ